MGVIVLGSALPTLYVGTLDHSNERPDSPYFQECWSLFGTYFTEMWSLFGP